MTPTCLRPLRLRPARRPAAALGARDPPWRRSDRRSRPVGSGRGYPGPERPDCARSRAAHAGEPRRRRQLRPAIDRGKDPLRRAPRRPSGAASRRRSGPDASRRASRDPRRGRRLAAPGRAAATGEELRPPREASLRRHGAGGRASLSAFGLRRRECAATAAASEHERPGRGLKGGQVEPIERPAGIEILRQKRSHGFRAS